MHRYKEIIVAIIAAFGVVAAAWISQHKDESKGKEATSQVVKGNNSTANQSNTTNGFSNNFSNVSNSTVTVNQGNVDNGSNK